jgi:hypothetical protein
MNYFLSIKDITDAKMKYTPALNLASAIFAIKDTVEREKTLIKFLSAKNDFTVNNAINVTNTWLEKNPYSKFDFPQHLESIIQNNKNSISTLLALKVFLKYTKEENKDRIWEWYSKNQYSLKKSEEITRAYKAYIKRKTIENTKLYLATKNAVELEKIVDSLDYQPYSDVKYEVRELIESELDIVFNDVYYRMIQKGWRVDVLLTFLFKNDVEKAQLFLDMNYKKSEFFHCMAYNFAVFESTSIEKLNKIIKYWLINGNDDKKKSIILYAGRILSNFTNKKLDISNELWAILKNDLNKESYSDLAIIMVVLSFDKKQKNKLKELYKAYFDNLTDKPFVQKYFIKNGVFEPYEYTLENLLNIHQFNPEKDYTIIQEFYFKNVSAEIVSNNIKLVLENGDSIRIISALEYGKTFLEKNPNQSLKLSNELWNLINEKPTSENLALAMLILSYDKKEKERLEILYQKNEKYLKIYNHFYNIKNRLIQNGLSINTGN